MNKDYEILCGKQILAILDGDINFGMLDVSEYGAEITISMPYLSGSALCDISNKFGLPVSYGSSSRWMYLDNAIRHCVKHNTTPELLAYIFSKKQFADKLRGLTTDKIEKAYAAIVNTIIDKINGELYFSGYELNIVGSKYCISKKGANPLKIDNPSIRNIDRKYISDISHRAINDIEKMELDSAITKSRTLLEEVFCYVIEKAGHAPCNNGKIGDLFRQVKELYNMHTDKDVDKRINSLLSGLNSIVSAVSEMRNNNSDSHGVGARRINISKHHARLCLNAAAIMAEFILEVAENNSNRISQP